MFNCAEEAHHPQQSHFLGKRRKTYIKWEIPQEAVSKVADDRKHQ